MASRNEAAAALARIVTSGNDLEQCLAAQALGRIGDASAADALIAALRDPDEDVRVDAATAIIALSIEDAVPTIIENIAQDPCVDAKIAYARAIAHFRAEAAVPVLRLLVGGMAEDEIAWDDEDIAQSESDDWLEVQLAAVEALGQLGTSEAADDIRAAMEDEFGQDLLRPGLVALAQMGDAGLEIVLDYLRSGTARARKIAVDALRQCAPDRLSGLLDELLADADASVRLIALAALPAGDPRLVDCLDDADETVRSEAAARLVRLQPARLRTFLDDESEAVRVAALGAFAGLSEPPAVDDVTDLLLDWLDKGTPRLACASAELLPMIDAGASVEPLRRAALRRGAAGEIRRAAVSGLAKVSPGTAVETLVEVARDPVRPIRLEAIGGIARIAADGEDEDRRKAGDVLLAALSGSLVAPPDEAETDKTDAAAEEDEDRPAERHGRHAAKEDRADQVNRIRIDREGNIIEARPEPETVENAPETADEPALEDTAELENAFPTSTLDSLQDGFASPTDEAASGEIKLTSEDLSFLELAQGRQGKRVLSPEQRVPAHTDVRVLAARVLADLKRADVVDSLVSVLEESNDELRFAAGVSLADLLETPEILSEEAGSTLARHLADRSPTLRLWLTRAASAARSPGLVEALRARVDDEESTVRAEAILGLSRLDPDFQIEPYLQDHDMTVRQCAGKALMERHGAGARDALIELAFGHGGTDRLVAARYLRDTDRHAANAEVIARLQSSESAVDRRIAIEVLGELNAVRPLHAVVA